MSRKKDQQTEQPAAVTTPAAEQPAAAAAAAEQTPAADEPAADEPEAAAPEFEAAAAPAALEFETESASAFSFAAWVVGHVVKCRLYGMVAHPDDDARHPDFKHVESNVCENDGAFKKYYLLEMLGEDYKPTGVFMATNTYWSLEQFFASKIEELGTEITLYALNITLVDEVVKKGRAQKLKIFNIQRGKTPTMDAVRS